MADAALKHRIHDALRRCAFSGIDEAVDVSDGEIEPNIHVVIFSRKFDGLGYSERQDLITDALETELPQDQIGYINLVVGVSPEEAKAFS